MNDVFETDRSGILSFQKCPRDRYYSRHFGGKGIEKLRRSLPLVFGAAFHVGTEPLLLGKGIEAAVASALLHLNLAFSVESVDLEEKQTAYAVEEQRAIAEGLLRAWWIEKGKRFLEEFEVIEVEQEGRAQLTRTSRRVQLRNDVIGATVDLPVDPLEAAQATSKALVETVTDSEIVLMFRPDALVREKLTGDLYIVSWKTASTFGAYTINSINSDMQSISEVWGVLNDKEPRYRKREMCEGRSSNPTVRVSRDGIQDAVLDLATPPEQHGLRLVETGTVQRESVGTSQYVDDDERANTEGIDARSSLPESELRTPRSSRAGESRRELSQRASNEVHSGADFRSSTVETIGSSLQSTDGEIRNKQAPNLGSDSRQAVEIEGILYLFCVKGQRCMDDYLGFKTQDTPLAYGWRKAGVTPEEDEWAWKYKWASEEEGRKFQQLPKGFRKVSIWDNYEGGVKAWIDALAAREIIPRHINPFEAIFPESMPVSRRADEIESWRRQIVSQESRIRQRVKAVEEAHGDEATLDREFPQHTANCYNYNSPCQFFDACFKPAVHADPIGSGLYKIRTANHPEKGSTEE